MLQRNVRAIVLLPYYPSEIAKENIMFKFSDIHWCVKLENIKRGVLKHSIVVQLKALSKVHISQLDNNQNVRLILCDLTNCNNIYGNENILLSYCYNNNKRVLKRNITKILSSAKPTKTKTCTLQNCRLISHHPSTSLSQFCSGAKIL